MAAIHLLPRELLTLLARGPHQPSAQWPTSPFHPNPRSLSPLALFALQWPRRRHRSDYSARRTRLDPALAREFDRPEAGYAFPGTSAKSTSAAQQAGANSGLGLERESSSTESFMEDEGSEYTQAFSLSNAGEGPTASSSSSYVPPWSSSASSSWSTSSDSASLPHSGVSLGDSRSSVVRSIRRVRLARSLDEMQGMLAWFSRAPSRTSLRDNADSMLYTRLFLQVKYKLLSVASTDISALAAFGALGARKGFASKISTQYFAHLSRFSTYEKLAPFWIALTHAARDVVEREADSSIQGSILEKHLALAGNAMIRAQCLAARYVDALNLLKLVRSLQYSKESTYEGFQRLSTTPIIPFTYQMLFQELARHGAHPGLLEELQTLYRQDWQEVPPVLLAESSQTKAVPHDTVPSSSATSASLTPKEAYTQSLQRLHDGLPPDPILLSILKRNKHRDPQVARSLSKLKYYAARAEPKAVYVRLRQGILAGTSPAQEELVSFRQLCQQHDALYLVKALERAQAAPSTLLSFRRLKSELMEGKTPSARSLEEFIEECRRAKTLNVAQKLGDWMDGQGPRYRSLWRVARMQRLVAIGKPEEARRALTIFADSFALMGVPDQVTQYARLAGESDEPDISGDTTTTALLEPNDIGDRQPRPSREKMWPSSHGIAIAIRALLTINPNLEDVQAIYRSFMYASYASNADLPIPMLPDQLSYEPFIKALVKHGRTELAMDILADMSDRGVTPNLHNWNTVIGGYAAAGNTEAVEAILERMEANQAAASGQHSSLGQNPAQSPVLAPYLAQASHLYASLGRFTFSPPDLVTYTTVIRGLAQANKLDAAKQIRSRLYAARSENGGRLFKFGENRWTGKALDIVASMDRLQQKGEDNQRQRL